MNNVRSQVIRWSIITVAGIVASGCAAFATVRSAEVRTGPTATVQASYAGGAGNTSGWFWNDDCVQECNRPIGGADLVFAYGSQPAGGIPRTLGFGLSGPWPYAEGYWQ